MKKCPTCQKTFEDNLKFCQSDGTPLVVVAEETPVSDPYKTMVASDIKMPSIESQAEGVSEAEPIAEAAQPGEPEAPVAVPDEEIESDDVLEIPVASEPEDPMKTMVVTGSDTSGNIEVPAMPKVDPLEMDSPPLESPPPPPEPPESEAATIISPELPKFSEPDVQPPGTLVEEEGSGDVEQPEPSSKPESKPTIPIPSPFEESMPPGFAQPNDSPFNSSSIPVPEPEPAPIADAAMPPPSPFAEAPDIDSGSGTGDWSSEPVQPAVAVSPVVSSASGSDPFGSNAIPDSSATPATGGEGENKTLAIVSLVSGIFSILCCFLGIVAGPAALITGFLARGKISQDPGQYGGGTMALIGMILGAIGFVLFVVWFLLQVLGSLPALMEMLG